MVGFCGDASSKYYIITGNNGILITKTSDCNLFQTTNRSSFENLGE